MAGDPGVESIYNWTQDGPEVGYRGANGKGDGVHILTGQCHAPTCKAPAQMLQQHRNSSSVQQLFEHTSFSALQRVNASSD